MQLGQVVQRDNISYKYQGPRYSFYFLNIINRFDYKVLVIRKLYK